MNAASSPAWCGSLAAAADAFFDHYCQLIFRRALLQQTGSAMGSGFP
jgi:hypothetical protein